jgi:hypothetical protein
MWKYLCRLRLECFCGRDVSYCREIHRRRAAEVSPTLTYHVAKPCSGQLQSFVKMDQLRTRRDSADTISLERNCEAIPYAFIGYSHEDEIARGYFQQSGATTHTARVSLTLLRDMFADRVLSKSIWPPRSPDLTPADYYLWSPMKGAVYKDYPHTSLKLKEAIENFIRNIPSIKLLCLCKQDKIQGTYAQLLRTYLRRGHNHAHRKRKLKQTEREFLFSDRHILVWTTICNIMEIYRLKIQYCATVSKSQQLAEDGQVRPKHAAIECSFNVIF